MKYINKILAVITLLIAAHPSSYGQNKMYGMTQIGGNDNVGVIYSSNTDGTNPEVVHEFKFDVGIEPKAGLFLASNGKFYGFVDNVAVNGKRYVFEYDHASKEYLITSEIPFMPNSNSKWMEASDGHLYIGTTAGGTNNRGVIIQYNITTKIANIVAEFNDIGISSSYNSLIEEGGKLYGTSGSRLFSYELSTGTLTPLAMASLSFSNLVKGSNGKLYGVTLFSGSESKGRLFEYDIADNSLVTLISFTGTEGSTLGTNPIRELVISDNFIYGVTNVGGTNDLGTLYQYDYVNSIFTSLHEFSGTDGGFPISINLASDGNLYGSTFQGGNHNDGVLFKYSIGDNIYSIVTHLEAGVTGAESESQLEEGPSGELFGVLSGGGASSNSGVLFSLDKESHAYEVLVLFNSSISGHKPGSTMALGEDGLLYGTTQKGGIGNYGTLFSYNPDSESYVKLEDFASISGNNAQGGLIEINGSFYGTTYSGGDNDSGILYKYESESGTLAKLLDFSVGSADGGDSESKGSQPLGGLTKASNGKLYGLTFSGGDHGHGLVYMIDPSDDSYTRYFPFYGPVSGKKPIGELVEGHDGLLYGLTFETDNASSSSLFSFDPSTNQVERLHVLSGSMGYQPHVGLTKAFNGRLYGVTTKGGTGSVGTLIEFDPYTNTLTKKVDFTGSNGDRPMGKLTLSSNGNLYGVTQRGGADGLGVRFEYNPYNNVFTVLESFNGTNGASPVRNGMVEVFETNVPVVTKQPIASVNVCEGKSLELMVFASGPDLTYQWKIGSENITGANSSYFRIDNISESQDGSYSCVVTNSHGSATSEVATVSVALTPAIALDEIPAKMYEDDPFELSFSIDEGSTFDFTSSNLEVATIAESTVTIVTVGTTTITLSAISANGCTAAVDRTLTVNKADQTITFDALLEVIGGLSYDLVASASSGLEVTYTSSNTDVATIDENRLHVHDLGEVVITAHQAGNSNYNSTSEQQTLTISKVLEVSVATQASIFPNPASHSLEVSGMARGASNLTVYDLQGQVRYNQTLTSEKQISIDISNYPVGMYLLKISSGQKVDIHKFYKSEASN